MPTPWSLRPRGRSDPGGGEEGLPTSCEGTLKGVAWASLRAEDFCRPPPSSRVDAAAAVTASAGGARGADGSELSFTPD